MTILQCMQIPHKKETLTEICKAQIIRKHHHWMNHYPNVHGFASFYFVLENVACASLVFSTCQSRCWNWAMRTV